jgi:glycosyltransferase involved in cell wall biosynthesis
MHLPRKSNQLKVELSGENSLRAQHYPTEYFHNPSINKPLAEIYADLDRYSYEYFGESDDARLEVIDFIVPLPPLYYEGKFIKGIFFSQAVDWLIERFPQLPQFFHSLSYSMGCSYPWSLKADGLMVLYQNSDREAWFRQNSPDRANQILLPLEEPDFTNEYSIAPLPNLAKDIDLLSVSRFLDQKNLPFIAKALRIYRQKYSHAPIRLTLIAGKNYDVNFVGLADYELAELSKMEQILGCLRDYVHLVPRVVHHYQELPSFYSRAKGYVLGSLIEGKNRSLSEAISCNLPALVCTEFNQYARGSDGAFPCGAGHYADFDPESFADGIYHLLQNPDQFQPRQQFLRHSGRRNFLNICIDRLPYYAENLPEFKPGHHWQNLWLDLAMQHNYQLSLVQFLDGGNHLAAPRIQGITQIERSLTYYFDKFS